MPIVNEIFGNYGNQISDLLGNVNDVIVGDNYTKALQELAKFEDQKNQLARFENLNKNFLGLDLNNVPTKKQVQLPGFNFENPEFLNTDAGKKFMDDQTKVNPDAKNTKYTTKDIENYLSIHSPEAIENLKLDPRFYGLQQSEMPLNKDEYENEAYRTAGFTDEDIMFYNDYKNKKLDPKGFNKSIDVFVGKKMLDLMSQGSYGDSRAKMLANLGAGMKMVPPEYATMKDAFGGVYYYDKDKPWEFNKMIEGPGEEINSQLVRNPYMIEEDGKYYWVNPVFQSNKYGKTGFVEQRSPGTAEQYRKWLDEQSTNADKIRERNALMPRRTSSRRGSVSFQAPKGIDYYRNLTPDAIYKMTSIDEINNLRKNAEYLTKEARDAMANVVKNQVPNSDVTLPGQENYDYGEGFTGVDPFDADAYESQVYSGLEEFKNDLGFVDEELAGNEQYMQATNNVQTWIADTIAQWKGAGDGRLPTPEEWLNEIFQEEWSDVEFAIIEEAYKKLTGQEIPVQ